MKNLAISLIGFGIACFPMFAVGQSFPVKASDTPRLKITQASDGRVWDQATQQVQHRGGSYHGPNHANHNNHYYGPRHRDYDDGHHGSYYDGYYGGYYDDDLGDNDIFGDDDIVVPSVMPHYRSAPHGYYGYPRPYNRGYQRNGISVRFGRR